MEPAALARLMPDLPFGRDERGRSIRARDVLGGQLPESLDWAETMLVQDPSFLDALSDYELFSEGFDRHLLPDIWCPVLILRAGRDGALTAEEAQTALNLLPDARLITLEGVSHGLHWEAPDLVLAACRAQEPRIGRVTRSFFESLDLLRLAGHDGGSRPSTGRDTCFVNIVWENDTHVICAGGPEGPPGWKEQEKRQRRASRNRQLSPSSFEFERPSSTAARIRSRLARMVLESFTNAGMRDRQAHPSHQSRCSPASWGRRSR